MLPPYDPRAAMLPMIQAALAAQQQNQAPGMMTAMANANPNARFMRLGGMGAGQAMDRLGPNVPQRSWADMPGDFGSVLSHFPGLFGLLGRGLTGWGRSMDRDRLGNAARAGFGAFGDVGASRRGGGGLASGGGIGSGNAVGGPGYGGPR